MSKEAAIRESFRKVISDYQTYAKLLKIRNKQGKIQHLSFNAPQLKYHRFKQELRAKSIPVRVIILKYRQGGFTTYEQGESYWMSATRENQEIMTIANTEDNTKKIFQMVQLMHDLIDPHFKPDRKRESSTKLEFPRHRSNFYISTAGSQNIGVTLSKAHCSEFAYWPDPKGALNLLKEAVPLDAELVIESTPNGFNEFEELYSGAQDLYNPRKDVGNAFYRFFIRWFDDPQYQLLEVKRWDDLEKQKGKLTTDEKVLIDKYQLTPMQIAWRRWKVLEFGGDLEQFWEKYPEDDIQCFLSSGKSFFNLKEVLTRMIAWASQYTPIEVDQSIGLKIWEHPQPDLKYCAGADPAQGVENDGSSFHMVERNTGRTVLTMTNYDIPPYEFAHLIHKYCVKYNDAFLTVERNNHGHTVLSTLMNTLSYSEPWKLYYHHDYIEDFKPIQHQMSKERNFNYQPGFPTKSNTKAMLLNEYKRFVEEYPESCLDKDTIAELKTFKRLKGGKLGAEPPKKDDRVISAALAQWGRATDPVNDNFVNNFKTY